MKLSLTQRDDESDPQSLVIYCELRFTASASPSPAFPEQVAGTHAVENPGNRVSSHVSERVSHSMIMSCSQSFSERSCSNTLDADSPLQFQAKLDKARRLVVSYAVAGTGAGADAGPGPDAGFAAGAGAAAGPAAGAGAGAGL
jgi:hypothetical protein